MSRTDLLVSPRYKINKIPTYYSRHFIIYFLFKWVLSFDDSDENHYDGDYKQNVYQSSDSEVGNQTQKPQK